MRSRSTTDGYLTVYLSLLITVVLSLVLALLQGARIGEAKMRSEIVTDIAMTSVLAEYNRALFERYDLLLVDMTYGSADGGITKCEEHLAHYINKNFERSLLGTFRRTADLTGLRLEKADIPQYSVATDNGGAVLRRQILAYMEGEPVTAAVSQAMENLVIVQSDGTFSEDIAAQQEENEEALQEVLSENGISSSDYESPTNEMEVSRSIGILPLTHPAHGEISDVSVTLADYASHRDRHHGTGLDDGERLSAGDLALIEQYIFEKCASHGHEIEGSHLKYEIEYLIEGGASDYDNLERIARKLFFWREASNAAQLFSDEGKQEEAELIATVAAFLVAVPELKDPLKISILFAWSFAETVVDLRTLFSGGKIPLYKTQDSWCLKHVWDILFAGSRTADGDTGLSYDGYLRMLLLMTDLQTKTLRLADIMEMDVRDTEGNSAFRMDLCLDCYTAEVSVTSGVGFSGTFVRSTGYEMRDE